MYRSDTQPEGKIFWTFIVFWLLFGIKVGAWSDTINLLAFALFLTGLVRWRSLPFRDPVVVLLTLYCIHTNTLILISSYLDTWHFFQPWRALLVYLGIHFAVKAMIEANWSWKDILSAIHISIYIHAGIMIFTFVFPDVRIALNEFTGFIEKSYLRSPGLTHAYGLTSLIMAFPFLSAIICKNTLCNSWFEKLGLVLCFFSLFISGRIGLYTMPILLMFALLYMWTTFRLRTVNLVSVFAVTTLTFVLIIWFSQEGAKILNLDLNNSLGFALYIMMNEGIANALELYFTTSEGNPSIQSLETIRYFIFHNNSFVEYLFGTGLYGRGDPVSHLFTDISYAHFFSMGGLVGITLLILIYIFPLLEKYQSENKDLLVIVSVFTFVVLVSNYKEASLLTRNIFSLWAFLVMVLKRSDSMMLNMRPRDLVSGAISSKRVSTKPITLSNSTKKL